MEIKRNNLWHDLNELDNIGESRLLTVEEKLDKDWLQVELKKTTVLEELCWRQV